MNRRTAVIGALVVFCAGLLIVIVTNRGKQAREDRFRPFEGGESAEMDQLLKSGLRAPRRSDFQGRQHNQPQRPPPRAEADVGETDRAMRGEYADPENQRVLGPNGWMAPVDPQENERIDQVFEESRAARYDPNLNDAGRAASVAVARQTVTACFDAFKRRRPDASGRIVVMWTAGAATAGQGRITNPRLGTNYQLQDAAFESCIVNGLRNQRFDSDAGDPIEVEVPFFFDGTDL